MQRCPQPTRRPFETRMHQAVRRAAMMLPVTVGVAHAVRPSVTIGDEQSGDREKVRRPVRSGHHRKGGRHGNHSMSAGLVTRMPKLCARPTETASAR